MKDIKVADVYKAAQQEDDFSSREKIWLSGFDRGFFIAGLVYRNGASIDGQELITPAQKKSTLLEKTLKYAHPFLLGAFVGWTVHTFIWILDPDLANLRHANRYNNAAIFLVYVATAFVTWITTKPPTQLNPDSLP